MRKASKPATPTDPARRHAVIYARVSSKEQEKEGFSIPAQLKLVKEYAAANGFTVVQEYIDVETAKQSGRTAFGEMVAFLKENPAVRSMIAQRPQTYDLGGGRTYTRQYGELLHPEHEPAHVLSELKREMGPIAFSAQYQQTPIPPGGTIIKRKWLTTYDEMASRPDDRIVMTWDIALSEIESGDYSACVVLLIRKEIVYILEVVRGRFPFETLKKKVMELKRRYSPSTLLVEDSPISRGLIQSLREQSINVTAYKPDTDKRARLIAQTDLFAGGSVRLPRRAGWLEEFVAELLSFPGRHDDQIDALTQGLAWGRQQWSRKVIVSPLRGGY